MTKSVPEVDLMWSLRCPDGKFRQAPCPKQFTPRPDLVNCGSEGCPGGPHECALVMVDQDPSKKKPKIKAEKPAPPPIKAIKQTHDPIEYVVVAIFLAGLVVLGTGTLWLLLG